MNNFKCKKCGKEFYINKHSVAVKDGNIINKDSYGNEIKCDVDGEPLQTISKFSGEAPMFAKVGSMSPDEKKDVLKKRSSAHFQKEIKEQAHEMDRAMKNQLLGK